MNNVQMLKHMIGKLFSFLEFIQFCLLGVQLLSMLMMSIQHGNIVDMVHTMETPVFLCITVVNIIKTALNNLQVDGVQHLPMVICRPTEQDLTILPSIVKMKIGHIMKRYTSVRSVTQLFMENIAQL